MIYIHEYPPAKLNRGREQNAPRPAWSDLSEYSEGARPGGTAYPVLLVNNFRFFFFR